MSKTNTSKVSPIEVKAAVDRLGRAFEEFKNTNDSAETERRAKGAADALLEEKLNNINEELSRLQNNVDSIHLNRGRPSLVGAEMKSSPDILEHKSAFYNDYIRKGSEVNLAGLEQKALNIGTDADGGFAVPEELDQNIDKLLRDISPIRRIANVIQIGSANYRKLVNTGGAASGWASETGARTETTSPTFSEIVPPLGELYANPAATQQMLDDAFFNVKYWVQAPYASS